ncbi:MAG: hypothetical protein PHO07_03515 [Pirellulales bacterium]|nr:hypothetical protein [Pirellulales bacterium]
MAISRGYIYQGPRVLKRSRFALAVAVAALACRLLAGAEPPTLSPRELFRLGGIEERQLEVLGRGGPWHEADRQVLRNMLYRIAQDVRPIDLEYWSHGPPDLSQLAEQPEAYRAEVFALRGVVERIEPCELADARGSGSEFALLWRCRLRLESGELVEVLSAKTPRAWKPREAIAEPAAAMAFFLGDPSSEPGGLRAVFLAARMAWYPPTDLGRLGMDVGLLDDVPIPPPPKRNEHGGAPEIDWETRRLTAADHECFYQMLAAAGRAAPGELSRWAKDRLARQRRTEYSVVPLFNEPHLQQGKLVELSGTARRILPVRVGEPEVIERFGIDQYYQVYLFTADSQDNPLVFCLRRLPEGLPTGDGPEFGEALTVPGFFFKTWSYRSAVPANDGKVERQLAPLLIGDTAVWHPYQAPADSPAERLIGTVLVLGILAAVWLVLHRFRRGDREFERRIWRRRPAEMSEIEWDRFGGAASEGSADTAPPGAEAKSGD